MGHTYRDRAGWHKTLIERMTLDIEGVRPALFDRDFALIVDELMRFRRLFRNLYKVPLIPRKVAAANSYAEVIYDRFLPFHESFDRFLKELKRELDE